ncbi:carbohydrate ABC transporter permease [bacterium]|nr:carbohydrate ABC transporter permease [bacterium]
MTDRPPLLHWFSNGVFYLVMIMLSLVFMTPVLWLLSSSLQSLSGVFSVPYQWLPQRLHWENYHSVLTVLPFVRYFSNTLLITGLVLFGTLTSSSMVAYGFSRLKFCGRQTMFSLCIATMLLPGQVTMIPLYILFARLGWVDTLLPLIVPAFFGSPFYIFLLRQFFLTIPADYDEAARLDGAGPWRIYWHIILPQAKPALATVTVFSFIGVWNDFFNPLIYINSFEKATLTLGLNFLKTQIIGSGVTQWPVLMAAAVLVLIPNVLIFFLAQRHFIKGINVGGLRG